MILQQVCFKVISCDLNNIIIHTITNSVPPNLYYNPITIVFQVVSFILYRTVYIIYGGNVLSLLTRHIMKCLNVSWGLTEWVQSTWKLEPSNYVYIKISILFFVFLEEIAILLRISFKICINFFFHADLYIYIQFIYVSQA